MKTKEAAPSTAFGQRLILLSLLVFLIPVNIGTLAVNYTFCLLLLWGTYQPVRRIPGEVGVYLLFLVTSYLSGVLFHSNGDGYFLVRQLLSFLVFIGPALLLLVRMPFRIHRLFDAILIASSVYSLAIIVFIATSTELSLLSLYGARRALNAVMPDYPQRYVVLLIFAFFYAWHKTGQDRRFVIPLVVVSAGILLTVTRAAILAVPLGLIAYATVKLPHPHQAFPVLAWRRVGVQFAAGAAALVVLGLILAKTQALHAAAAPVLEKTRQGLALMSLTPTLGMGSTADRLTWWLETIRTTMDVNPLLGSGFAGIHLFDGTANSAHNQYLDVMLRTGLIGLGFYLYFWARLFMYYARRAPFVFAGAFAIFVYGFFHETTKLPYAAFLFFVLVGGTYVARRSASAEPVAEG